MEISFFQGYSEEMLLELDEISKNSAERQMHALLSRMLARGDTERKDVIGRTKSIIEGMSNSISHPIQNFHIECN